MKFGFHHTKALAIYIIYNLLDGLKFKLSLKKTVVLVSINNNNGKSINRGRLL